MQTAYKILNSWTVTEETPNGNTAGSGWEMEHDEENSGNGKYNHSEDDNNEQSDDDDDKRCDDGNKNELDSAENSFLYKSRFLD